MMTAMQTTCSACGKELPPDAPRGLCPECLFQLDEPTVAGTSANSAASTAGPAFNTRRFGDYELLDEIARGGMGIVYRARQVSLDRIVALKMILFGALASAEQVRRFRIEASAAGSLQHPNIVAVHEVGLHEGQHFMVMDYVDGSNLARLVQDQPLPAKKAASYLKAIAEAVQFAHDRGILHRDLKPSNVLIGSDDRPRVTDFGLAKRFDTESSLTLSGHVLGSPNYLPPEQAGGGRQKVGRTSDVYSLGAILYHLLTARPPFRAETVAETLVQVQQTEPLAPRLLNASVPRDLETICLKCLEKEPPKRYATAQQLADDLDLFLRDEPIHARPVTRAERAWRWCRRKPALAGSLAAAAVLLLIVAVGSPIAIYRINQARAAEKVQLKRAEDGSLKARQTAYASDMNLAQRALEMNNLGSALNLLNRYRPTGKSEIRNPKSEIDLRGWEWRYLWSQCQSDAESVFCKSSNSIKSLSVSHDGVWLATGLSQTGVSIWDLAARQEIARLPASGFIVRVAFSPREPLLAYSDVPNYGSSSTNHSIHLWNGATRQIVRTLSIGYQSYGVAFSEDGRTLVTSTRNPDNQITLWRVSDGKKLASYPAPQTGTAVGTPFALARDLSVAAHATEDDKVRVIDLGTGQERWQRKATDDYVLALALSPDGKILASGAGFADAVIRLWDVASGRELGRLEGHRSGIHQLMFWPDGKSLASASFDQTIRLWNVTDSAHGRLLNILRGHRGCVRELALLPDHTTLASGSDDGTVCLWNTVATRQKRKHLTLPIPVGPWRFTPDSKSVVTLEDHDGVGHVARWSQGTDFQEMQPLFDVGTNIHEGCFSRDGRWLAISWASGDVRVWDLQSRSQSCEFTAHARPVIPREFLADKLSRISRRAVPEQSVIPRTFTAEGRKLMIVHTEDNSLHEWDLTTRQETRSWPTALGRYTGAFSPDGKWYLTSILNPDTKTVTSLVELSSGRETNLNLGWYYAASFSADGRLFALGKWEDEVRLFETATAKEVAKLSGTLGQVQGVGFSPDGTRFVTGNGGQNGSQETVALWDMESHEKLLTLEGRGSLFDDVAFSPDGNVLAACNWHGVLHLWRAPTWAEIEATEQAQANAPSVLPK